ncbi:RNA polymerase, sigma-24 subunit, ECF subfamily [Ktedonobacter racemifer DSM 44963]|uniref:RNA polymerase, sigma-24 subunit, ECF subfamily n=2 Tax=Ktedonobacter racemifer TaxID=363277 RepID=D6U2L6_KTERA|nr:RNA polymerase, sigma-24 subunit, ECF subfamily [Ktedonobacter racemifer DSM 44963]
MHQSQQPMDYAVELPVAALYRRHAHALLTYIRALISPEDAEDILVEVFLVVIQNETPLRLGEKEQLTWLRRVARNKIIDRYRHLGRLPAFVSLEDFAETLIHDDGQEPEVQVLRSVDHAQLRAYLSSLPQLHQEILRLRFADDLSTKAIAQRLAKSDGAIRMLLSRILNRLRAMYEQARGEEHTHESSR